MEYIEIQANEVEALKAIYAGDFLDLPSAAVWNQQPSPHFSIQLRPSSEFEESKISVLIEVSMTATYPKSLPKIEIKKTEALSGRQTEVLKQVIESTMKELKGSEMIYEVCTNLKDQLDEWARSVSEAAPSLDLDRQNRLKIEETKQKELQDEIQREREAIAKQEEKKFDSLILQELQKSSDQPVRVSDDQLLVLPEHTPHVTTYRRPIRISKGPNGAPLVFRQVMCSLKVYEPFFGNSFLCKPLVPTKQLEDQSSSDENAGEDDTYDVALMLTKVGLSNAFWRSAEGARMLNELNSEMETVRQFRHIGITPLYEFTIERFAGAHYEWEITYLVPYTNMTPLSDILDTTTTISLKTMQIWVLQILESLESLHKTGLRHKCICPENVMIHVNPETGETSVLLSHPQYIYKLFCMNAAHKFCPSSGARSRALLAAENGFLIPPEGRNNTQHSPSSKWDLWQVGMLMLQMLVGKREFVKVLDDPETYLRSKNHAWPASLSNLLSTLLNNDPAKRPTALELLTDQFFRTEFELRGEEVDDQLVESQWVTSSSGGVSEPNSLGVPEPQLPPYSRRRLSSSEETSLSRYKQDFDEGIMLGRGGFGEVVKARNKLDGRVYAVKKIRATSYTLSHILQEVVLLSRLNHQYVVRYYTVWLEDDFDTEVLESAAASESSEDQNMSSLSHSLSRLAGKNLTERDILDTVPSNFSDHHSLSALDLPSVSQDFMSDSGFIQFEYSDDDLQTPQAEGNNHNFLPKDPQDDLQSDPPTPQGEANGLTPISSNEPTPKRANLPKKTLYIQMEYCQNHTLGDLIKQGLYKRPKEYWRLLRQILVALSYIHGEGVIHRDLKPKNIFIDQANNIKIGDFGLARRMVQPVQSRQLSTEPYGLHPTSSNGSTNSLGAMSQSAASLLAHQPANLGSGSANSSSMPNMSYTDMVDEDLTTDVGTSLYAAVEITSGVNQRRGYNEKVDIFSLGIIFFEMVWGMSTEMERVQTIRRARTSHIDLPRPLLAAKELATQVDLIKQMLSHDPNKRPSAMGLLKSGKIPVEDREMTVQEALQNVRDPRVVQQLANALFSQPLVSAQQILYDRTNVSSVINRRSARTDDMTTFQGRLAAEHVVAKLREVFMTHGAVDNTSFRSKIFPRSPIYKMPTVVELLDSQGTVLQLPHDLTFPHARRLAECVPEYTKSCAFDTVYRALLENPGHHPAVHFEVDFDITTTDQNEDTARFAEAETMAVMHDSAYSCLPEGTHDLVIVIGHHDILSATLSHCGLSPPQHYTALSILAAASNSSLDRRSSAAFSRSNISSASLDMLSRFAFRENVENASARLSKLMPISDRISRALAQISQVVDLFSNLTASPRTDHPQVYFSPLIHTSTSEFYVNGVIFQLIDNKDGSSLRSFGTGSVLAVGGRYDALIKSVRNSMLDARTPLARAVGFGMSADKLCTMLAKSGAKQSRCQVFVSSLNITTLNTLGPPVLRLLWAHGIQADIISNVSSTEDLVDRAVEQQVPFLVMLKQAPNAINTNNTFKPLRVRKLSVPGSPNQMDTDLMFSELIQHLQLEMQVPQQQTYQPPPELEHYQQSPEPVDDANAKVVVLNDYGKIKGGRKNKWQLEERGVEAKQNFMAQLSSAPLVCVDLRDDILGAICTVSPHSTEDWKRRVVGLSPNQKAYIMNVQGKLSNEALKAPQLLLFSLKTENIFVYKY